MNMVTEAGFSFCESYPLMFLVALQETVRSYRWMAIMIVLIFCAHGISAAGRAGIVRSRLAIRGYFVFNQTLLDQFVSRCFKDIQIMHLNATLEKALILSAVLGKI